MIRACATTSRSRSSSVRSPTASSCPFPHTPFVREVIRRTHVLADENARRLGVSRRQFLNGVTGAAAALFVLSACSSDEAKSNGRRPGGSFDVTHDVDHRPRLRARVSSAAHEFIFDVQSHYVNYDQAPQLGEWTAIFPGAGCAEGVEAGSCEGVLHRRRATSARCSCAPTRRWRSSRRCRRPGMTGLSSDDMVTRSMSRRASAATGACSCTAARIRTAARSAPRSTG